MEFHLLSFTVIMELGKGAMTYEFTIPKEMHVGSVDKKQEKIIQHG